MTENKIIAQNPMSTIVAEYTPVKTGASKYQSEAELEKEFISILQNNGYEYLKIKADADLLANLRTQIERLNDYRMSDSEWERLQNEYLTKKSETVADKAEKIQDKYIYNLRTDSNNTKNIHIIDKENIHNNHLQVINQYETDTGTRPNRYDVSILVNGLPLVHIELKRRGVTIREAFNQIRRYNRESFWADSGLFEYVQLFVISNGTHTKYYSNTTREAHVKVQNGKTTGKKTSNTFEFTSWWADGKNKRIADLVDFTKTFFSKHALLSILTKYCIFNTDKILMVMRPYQIAASEAIMNRITMATNHKLLGSTEAGGYIWHTTGSGKTLTSFKTSQLASKQSDIAKVLFVVDRKDLDYQTIKEYEKFQKGAANSNTNTKKLTEQLSSTDPNKKLVITTIQKLDKFIKKNTKHPLFDKHVVLIFDECHRSQFGDMHKKIKAAFKKYNLFGFTGTPIFPENAVNGKNPDITTTAQAFGGIGPDKDKPLHVYTIVDAINDENVLPFRIDWVGRIKSKGNTIDKKVVAINTEEVWLKPKRISDNVKYILEHFDQKTYRDTGKKFAHKIITNVKAVAASKLRTTAEEKTNKNILGFNSIFAVSSINAANAYYAEFKKQQKELPPAKRLKIAMIYSFVQNDEQSDFIEDEDFDTTSLDKVSRDFLDVAIKDYNDEFKTNYDTSVDKFENYYKDLSMRVKNRDIDILLVVNMFLTGFDAPTLNTLWVDKNLHHHGLLQAFSRTNRILNSIKNFGNIVCFRDLEKATNESIAIFGNRDAGGIVLLKPYEDYYNGWDKEGKPQPGYAALIAKIQAEFPLPVRIEGEKAEKEFIRLYGAILRIKNILMSFDEFTELENQQILSDRDFQDYQSEYLNLYEKHRKTKDGEKESILDDIEFEIELVKQTTINIDYILTLVAQYHKSKTKNKDDILVTIDKAMDSSIELRSKKDLIERFIKTLNKNTDVERDWKGFADKSREEDLDKIIAEESLKPDPTRKFIKSAFRDGELKSTGTAFAGILPPVSMFDKTGARAKKKFIVLEKLRMFFEKYFGL